MWPESAPSRAHQFPIPSLRHIITLLSAVLRSPFTFWRCDMFDRLCPRSDSLARHCGGPLLEERRAYLDHLAKQGTAVKTLRQASCYLLTVAEYLRLAERPGQLIRYEEVERQAVRWAKRRSRSPCRRAGRTSRAVFLWRATDWLRFLGRLKHRPATTTRYSGQISAFADYLQSERGLSSATIFQRCWFVRRFCNRLGTSYGSLQEITIKRLDAVFREMMESGKYARATVRAYSQSLRAFFRYAEARGWCRNGVAEAIHSPCLFSQASLPAGPSWDDAQRLLATTEGDGRTDIRDRAILMLLIVYGLRSGEVSHLRLEDFDWERELLSVACSKSRQTRTFPLSRQVGDAVLRYLRDGRPHSTHREVFLSLRAPIRPLDNLFGIVAGRLRP